MVASPEDRFSRDVAQKRMYSCKILHKSPDTGNYEPRHVKTCLSGFATRVDSNWPAQQQRLARGLEFWI